MKPKAVVFDLFGDHLRYRDGRARTQALVALLATFDIGEPTARIVLSRMRREGWLDTEREGRQVAYQLTAKSWRLLDEGRSRIFGPARADWDGAWRMVVYAVADQHRAGRERLRRSLSWLGFGSLTAATWISPHDRLDEVERIIASLPEVRADLFTCQSRGLDADRGMVHRGWDLAGLAADYRDFVGQLQALPDLAQLASMPGEEALRLRIELVSAYRRFPFRDPDLPAVLLPEDWPGHRARDHFVAVHDALARPADAYVNEVLDRYGG